MKSFSTTSSLSRIFNAIKKTFNRMGIEIVEEDKENLVMEGHKEGSVLSFGNKIYISIEERNENKKVVYIDSESSAILQVFDWGTNDKIEKEFFKILRAELNR